MHKYWDTSPWVFCLLLFYSFNFCFSFIPPVYFLTYDSITVTREDKEGNTIYESVGPGEKTWAPKIPKYLKNVFIVAEDGRFSEHFGIDIIEIFESYKRNLKSDRIVRGGSTITQQVVRNAFLSHERSWIRKIREVLGAIILEQILTKDEIILWYANLCEFGRGIYGVNAAAQKYFRTKPQYLSLMQSIHLALVIPSPKKWSVGLQRKQLTTFGHKRFKRLARGMWLHGFISQLQYYQLLYGGNFGAPIMGYSQREESL